MGLEHTVCGKVLGFGFRDSDHGKSISVCRQGGREVLHDLFAESFLIRDRHSITSKTTLVTIVKIYHENIYCVVLEAKRYKAIQNDTKRDKTIQLHSFYG